jgi:hypothetical protein
MHARIGAEGLRPYLIMSRFANAQFQSDCSGKRWSQQKRNSISRLAQGETKQRYDCLPLVHHPQIGYNP